MNLSSRSIALAAALLFLTPLGPAADPVAPAGGNPVRVLILSGQNNHDWRSTTPKLVAILEETGRFEINVTEDPGALNARGLRSYDVILSNWNAFGLDPRTSEWPAKTKKAYLDFVRQGKGHVVVHAGSASFPDWSDYGRLTLDDLEGRPDGPRPRSRVPRPHGGCQPPCHRGPRAVHDQG